MKRLVKISFIILVIFSLISLNVFANEQEDNEIEEGNSQIDELKVQKDELEELNEESNEQLQFVQDELSSIVIEISGLNQTIYDKQTEKTTLEKKLSILNTKIVNTEEKLEEARENYDSQKSLLEERLVAMYEIGNTSYLELLLSSGNISDLVSNYYYISEIVSTDTEYLDLFKEKKDEITSLMLKLEKSKSNMNILKKELDNSSILLSNLVIIKNQKMQNLTEQESALQQQIEEYQAEIQAVESEIKILSLINGDADYVGGRFEWPVPGYNRISSKFGMRTHPITGVYKLHTGTDISAPYGATFVASNTGLVTKAGYNSAYGNMVIVDHGGGISTLYAHGSEILVSEGQIVKQGEPVLKVGSTGYSTGPHAHFEIRVKGDYVNPMDYLESDEDIIKNTDSVEVDT